MTFLQENLEVILITYNRKFFLENTLNALFTENSPVKNLSVKILDNASTDKTSELISQYAQKYPNITHIRNIRNIGGNANIVKAFEMAEKKYLWVLCDDDEFDFSNWNELEAALTADYDVVLTRKSDNDIGALFYAATFVPACIYKTKFITDTTISNAYDNVRNFFPHLAVFAKFLNDNSKIFIPSKNIVEIGCKNAVTDNLLRGQNKNEVPYTKRNMFFTVGYINSTELIFDKRKRTEIIENLRQNQSTLFGLFMSMIKENHFLRENSKWNLFSVFRLFSFSQKIFFAYAFLLAQIEFCFCNFDFWNIKTKEKWIEYFKFAKQENRLKKLSKKYKNKKIIIYGAGIIGEILFENYDMNKFDIVAVSDAKFKEKSTFKNCLAVPPEALKNIDADVILFTLYKPQTAMSAIKKLGVKIKTDTLIKRKKNIIID